MKKLSIVLMLAIALLMGSCKARVVNNVNTSRYENNVAYFQDAKTGEVFALVVIKTSVNVHEEGVGLAHIPKNEVTEKIKAQIKNYKE